MSAAKQNKSKIERIEVRLNAKQKSLFLKAAKLRGNSLTSFVITEMEKAANRIIHEHEIIHLTQEDQNAFVQAILESPKPSKKLIEASKRQKKQVESR